MSGGQAVGWKSYIYCLSFCKTNSFSYDICTVPNMLARQALMWSIDMWVSGFLIVLPHLVLTMFLPFLTMFSPFCIPLLSTIVSFNFLHAFLPISLQIVSCLLFIMYVLAVIVIVLGDLVGVWLWIDFNVFQNSIQWISLSVFLLGNICNPLLLLVSAWYVVYHV